MQTLLKKFSVAYWRMPEYTYIRFLVTVIMGFVLGTLYWKVGHKRCVQLFTDLVKEARCHTRRLYPHRLGSEMLKCIAHNLYTA